MNQSMDKIKEDVLRCKDILKFIQEKYQPPRKIKSMLDELQGKYIKLLRRNKGMGYTLDMLFEIKDRYHPELNTHFELGTDANPWWKYYVQTMMAIRMTAKMADFSNQPYSGVDFEKDKPTEECGGKSPNAEDSAEKKVAELRPPLTTNSEKLLHAITSCTTVGANEDDDAHVYTTLGSLGLNNEQPKLFDADSEPQFAPPKAGHNKETDLMCGDKTGTVYTTGSSSEEDEREWEYCCRCGKQLTGYSTDELYHNFHTNRFPCIMPKLVPPLFEHDASPLCSYHCIKVHYARRMKVTKQMGLLPPKATNNDLKLCESCFQNMEVRMVCARCRAMYYCSKECQTEDWRQHKHYCKKLKECKARMNSTIKPAFNNNLKF